MQVENFISQEPEISQQISLWNTQGSRVLRGNLLILPMNDSLLYVEPIYIQSEDEKTAIPELRRVVIGYGNQVVWGESLDEALVNMFGGSMLLPATDTVDTGATTVETGVDPGTESSPVPKDLLNKQTAISIKRKTHNALADWAEYGQLTSTFREGVLRQLEGSTQ